MAFGTALRLKSDVAAGTASVLARLAVRRAADEPASCSAAGRDELFILRAVGAAHRRPSSHAAREGVVQDGDGDDDSLARALGRLSRLARSPGLVAVVSDFRAEGGWSRPLRALGQRHSLIAVEVSDPRAEPSERRGPTPG